LHLILGRRDHLLVAPKRSPREKEAATEEVAARANTTNLQTLKKHHLAFALSVAISMAVFWPTLRGLVNAGLNFVFCSQILAAPFITAGLIYLRKNEIFQKVEFYPRAGGTAVVAGLILYFTARHCSPLFNSYDALAAAAFGVVVVWIAAFYAVYGPTALRTAVFPLCCLLIAVPIPDSILNESVRYLQSGSTAIADWLFQLLGVPVMRNGFLLSLPGLTIEVAKECSSVRSSVALVITCLLAGYFFLRSGWKRAALILIALPLSILKNGIRIVTLSLLSIYVSPAFMNSDLHRDGGILFYLLALAILFPIFLLLEKSDHQKLRYRPPSSPDPVGSSIPARSD
jgi:exosortase